MLQNQSNLQQSALKLMAESGDEELLQLTLDQINKMTVVSKTGDVSYTFTIRPESYYCTGEQVLIWQTKPIPYKKH